jgi:acyl-CoA dehydrogenase
MTRSRKRTDRRRERVFPTSCQLNPERILIAVEAIGIGQTRCAARRYARERVVLIVRSARTGDPAPAGGKMDVSEAAWQMAMRAAWSRQ